MLSIGYFFCCLLHSRNCWKRRSCSSGRLGAARAACARASTVSMPGAADGAGRCAGHLVQPLLRRLQPCPPLQFRREVHSFPTHMPGRFVELLELAEENVHELGNAAIAVMVVRPIVRISAVGTATVSTVAPCGIRLG